MLPIRVFDDPEKVKLLNRKNQSVNIKEFVKKLRKVKNKALFEKDVRKAYRKKGKYNLLILDYLKIKNLPEQELINKDVIIRIYKPKSKKLIRNYLQINKKLNLIDLTKSKKLTSGGFYVLSPKGAKLERALLNFMLDTHNNQGYSEYSIPIVASKDCFFGTGAFPTWEKIMYKIKDHDLYLNPTAEIQLTNFFSNETLKENDLPIKLQAHSRSFRLEKEKKKVPLIVHNEFGKVELLKFCKPSESKKEHLKILNDAEEIVKQLKLPYRILQLSVKRLGTAAKITYDIEVWCPGIKKWLEVSSVSNCGDFQARRMNTTYLNKKTNKFEYIHTIHASGTSIPRVLLCIIENYYTENKIMVPNSLVKYFGEKVIE